MATLFMAFIAGMLSALPLSAIFNRLKLTFLVTSAVRRHYLKRHQKLNAQHLLWRETMVDAQTNTIGPRRKQRPRKRSS